MICSFLRHLIKLEAGIQEIKLHFKGKMFLLEIKMYNSDKMLLRYSFVTGLH